jgi:DNA repair protein RecN (Recombination protein N)
MLKELRIKNLAIIDDLSVRFEDGLNVLTGETGAGKSIIVDSLSLCLGCRAQSDLIRSGEREAVVQAYFEGYASYELSHMGIDVSDDLILRRSISATGKSRAFINDTMVNLQTLTELSKSLVDIHGQHEHQSLLSIEKHRFFLDSYGKLRDDSKKVASLYREVQELNQEAVMLREKMKERAQRLDLLRFQIQEIEGADLKEREKENLMREKTILSNLSRLNELTESAYSMIYASEDSCIEKLSYIISKIREMTSIDKSMSPILNTLESALPLIEDGALSLRDYRDTYDFNPERLLAIDDRLDFIKRLEAKYGEGIDEIMTYRDEAGAEVKILERTDERLDSIKTTLEEKESMLQTAARTLSDKRRKTAHKIEKLVKHELRELALGDAEFLVSMKKEEISPHGFDNVEFLFSANPGEPPKPLVKIASGGELARVMLALKSILADFDNIPVLIFDEVDAGIGGKTAESVAQKLRKLSAQHQVLCTTHLPQIAAKGNFHLKIEKGQRDERACVEVIKLDSTKRLNEIARMLSGSITEVSRKHAQELLDSVF